MIALVTGSSGFCGRHLVRALETRGATVVRMSQRTEAAGVLRVDLTDVGAVAAVLEKARPDVVFHLHGASSARDQPALLQLNTVSAAAVLDAVERVGIEPAMLFIGSAAEYGAIESADLPVTEDHPLSPLTAYGTAKRAQTELALLAAQRGRRVVVARPSNVIGPGMPENFALASFARQLAEIEARRRPTLIEVGNLETFRDFIDVEDAVQDFLALAAEPSAVGRVFNVASGRAVRLKDALDGLIAAFGISVELRTDPSRLRAADVPVFYASRERLDRTVGSRALIPLSASLERIVADARARLGSSSQSA
jgi:GDP-4-dehydro-6-deoxy-D-mannose reductase